MGFRFTKMHGLGNDFVVVNAIEQSISLSGEVISKLADRHRGIGFDQLLAVATSPTDGDCFVYKIYNADGTEAEQCGNGVRCLARFLKEHHYVTKDDIRFETGGRQLQARIEQDGTISVDMGVPDWRPENIPFDVPAMKNSYQLEVNGMMLTVGAVSMGNPHAIIRVSSTQEAPVKEIGTALETSPYFPERVNVGFLEVINRNKARLRVHERGTGETLACGSGACAAMAWGRLMGWLEPEADIELLGGQLTLAWNGLGHSVWMRGPAETVYEGQLCD